MGKSRFRRDRDRWGVEHFFLAMLTVSAVLGLAGCNQSADGHRFERKEFERTSPNITIVTHASIADLRAKFPTSTKAREGDEIMAWSIIRSDTCEIHIVDPARSYQPEWIGHEVAHCVWGRFHK